MNNPLRPHSSLLPATLPALRRDPLPGAWQERLLLSDGRSLRLRPIEPGDAETLRRGFELLSAEEVRMRFLHPIREMSPQMAHQLTHPRPGKDIALVIAEDLPVGEALVGAVARAALDDDGRRAEFAILVSRLLGGHGLGRLLMRKLIRWARCKRLDELYGDVLDENAPMLRLATSLGFRREHRFDEPGLTRVRLSLQPEQRIAA